MILNSVALFNLKTKENSDILIFIRIGEWATRKGIFFPVQVFSALSDYSFSPQLIARKLMLPQTLKLPWHRLTRRASTLKIPVINFVLSSLGLHWESRILWLCTTLSFFTEDNYLGFHVWGPYNHAFRLNERISQNQNLSHTELLII